MRSISVEDQRYLLRLARRVVTHGVRYAERLPLAREAVNVSLQEPGASFVTLYRSDQLAGCMGTLEACRPLVEDVAENSYVAAFHDPRFTPLQAADLDVLHIEIALLSALQPLAVSDESSLKAHLIPGHHGLLIEEAGHRATFLPKVWQALPDKTEFLTQLKKKAGFSENYWSERINCFLYTTESFSDV